MNETLTDFIKGIDNHFNIDSITVLKASFYIKFQEETIGLEVERALSVCCIDITKNGPIATYERIGEESTIRWSNEEMKNRYGEEQ